MAKVKYLGDPENEQRTSIVIDDVECQKGEFVKTTDEFARRFATHPHFEVQGLRGADVTDVEFTETPPAA
ncbi:hypothetical protein KTE26_14320 [Ralstonia mannitolilytica]|uniref:hypothetical protein n=1 Tax=Ralstonia mannitolilytica TaxID=105219 RepID=UPI001C22FBED|nr:hypothetical protein [Ralstonia mannitolilytica]MBU9579606.1 hypothetical protein [Ralstonia mannitolilytica]